jgi:hypothetical protein
MRRGMDRDMDNDATARTLAFSAQSSKIFSGPSHSGVCHKIPSSSKGLAGCYDVRQVLGQSGKSLVCRADETVVRQV